MFFEHTHTHGAGAAHVDMTHGHDRGTDPSVCTSTHQHTLEHNKRLAISLTAANNLISYGIQRYTHSNKSVQTLIAKLKRTGGERDNTFNFVNLKQASQ